MKISKCILAAVIATTALAMGSCSSSGGDSLVDRIDYLAVRESDNSDWGFYSPDGEIKFADEFKNRPSSVVEGYFSVKENDGYSLYKFGDKLEVVKDAEGLRSIGYMVDGLIPVTVPKERISVIDGSGEKKFTLDPIGGKEIVSAAAGFCDGLLMVKTEEGNYGFVNTKGEVAIKPKYSEANNFSEGYALVGTYNKDKDETTFMVIDKKGETVFTLRKGMKPNAEMFNSGLLAVRDSNDRIVFLDTKGEEVFKCPSKVKHVRDYDNKYIVFIGDDYKDGVLDFEGNTVIRPKYESIQIISTGSFLASQEDRAVVLNADGEETLRIDDYESVSWVGKFGYLAEERRTKCFLDKEGKPVKNAEFYRVNIDPSADAFLNSDYFNTEAVVKDVCSLITDKGVDKYVIGEGPGAHFSNPADYTYRSQVLIDDLSKQGYRYSISVYAEFNMSMADYSYNFNGYDYQRNDYWREGCELYSMRFSISTETDWGNSGSEAIVSQLKDNGFKIAAQTEKGTSTYAALLTKGDLIVLVNSEKGSTSGNVAVAKSEPSLIDNIKSNIDYVNRTEKRSSEEEEEASEDYDYADSCAVEVEEVVAEDYY